MREARRVTIESGSRIKFNSLFRSKSGGEQGNLHRQTQTNELRSCGFGELQAYYERQIKSTRLRVVKFGRNVPQIQSFNF